MNAARRRNSGTGDAEKEWKRLSSLSRRGGEGSFAAADSAWALALELRSLLGTSFRLGWQGSEVWIVRTWCVVAAPTALTALRAIGCLLRDAEQRPQRVEAARQRDGSISNDCHAFRVEEKAQPCVRVVAYWDWSHQSKLGPTWKMRRKIVPPFSRATFRAAKLFQSARKLSSSPASHQPTQRFRAIELLQDTTI